MENARNKQIILKVYLDSSERKFIEVPIGPETSCRDIIDCCKEPGEQLCHLAELWRDCERPINETERPYDILEEWGIHRDEVKFYLRHEAAVGLSMRPGEQGRRNPYGYSRGDMRLDGGHNNHMHRGPGSELTLSELQDMASRQQQQIEQQQQMLLAKEQRLKFLKQQETRQQQLTAENERLRQLREKVEAQELKLKKLRAMRGQVDAFKNNNTTLGTELDSVKKMFNEKEKELAVAVAKVEQLTNQLEQLHTSYVKGVTPPETKTSEIEKLRQELMMRNKLNEDQNKKLTANTGVINSKKSEMSFLDKKIKELQERLRKKRSQISEKPKSNVAAVEPYIKRAPENLTKDDMYSVDNLKAGFGKENPKYQTLPYNTKFPDAGKAEDDLKYGDKMFINGGSGETRTEVPNINEPSKKIPITLATSMLSAAGQPSQSQAKPVTAELVKGTWPSRPGANIRNFGPKPYGQSYGVSMIPGAPLAPVRLQADGQSESSGQSSPVTSDHGPTTETTSPLQHKQINQVAPSKEVQYPPSQPPKENTQSQWATPEKGKERTPPPPLATSIAKYSTPIKKTAPASVYGQFKVTDSPKVSVVERQTVEPIQATQPVVVSTHQPEQPKLTEPTVTLKSLGNVSSGSGVTTTVQGGGEEKKNVKSVEGALNVLMTGKPATVATAQPYKYAPKSIANPYLNRLGSGAMDRYKQNMKNIYEPKQQEKQPETQTEVKIQTESPTAKVHPLNVNRPISPVKTTYGQKASHTPIPIQTMDNRPLNRPMSPNRANNQNIEVNRNIGPPSYTYAEQLRNQSTTDSNANFDSTPSIIHTNNTPMPFDTPKTSTPLTTLSSQNSQNQPNTVQYTPSAPKPTRRQIPVDNVSMATTPSPTSPSQQTEPPGSNADYLSTSQTFVNSNLDKNMRRQLFLYGTATLPQSPDSQSEQQQTSPTNYQTSPTNRQPSPQRTSPTRPLSPKKPHSEPAAKVNMRKKTNLRNKDSVKKSRRVSFDPLALLLDASLEGELELVMRTAKEVSNPSAANDEGITALHNAICAGHLDIVKFLIEFGCDSNSQDSDGWTPLHCAASCNNLPMVKFLVEHGACIFATTISDSETAAEKCEEDEDGYDGCSEFLYSIQEKLGILNGGVVYTLYQYKAQNPDELSFNPGYRMVVLRKGDEKEKDWWWVRHEDKEGYVARNLLGLYPRVRPKFPAPDSQA